MSAVAIIQARMGSSRLPGKVLLDLCGKPVLWHVVRRTQAAERVHRVLVATTRGQEDDAIEELCRAWGVGVCRGPAQDVLARYHEAVRSLDRMGIPVDLIVTACGHLPQVRWLHFTAARCREMMKRYPCLCSLIKPR